MAQSLGPAPRFVKTFEHYNLAADLGFEPRPDCFKGSCTTVMLIRYMVSPGNYDIPTTRLKGGGSSFELRTLMYV